MDVFLENNLGLGTSQIRGNSTDDIACWFIDINYNGESFFVRHAYFTGADEPYDKLKRALRAEIDESAWSSLYSTVSRPFDKPETGKFTRPIFGDQHHIWLFSDRVEQGTTLHATALRELALAELRRAEPGLRPARQILKASNPPPEAVQEALFLQLAGPGDADDARSNGGDLG